MHMETYVRLLAMAEKAHKRIHRDCPTSHLAAELKEAIEDAREDIEEDESHVDAD